MSGKFKKASEITAKPLEFLWPGRIPYAAITILDGEPATNKSTLIADIAARLSTGRMMWNCEPKSGGMPQSPEAVMILNPEDDAESTRARLRVAGANLELVHIYDQHELETADGLLLPRDGAEFTDDIRKRRVQLVVIDPLTAFLDRSLQSESSARRVMCSLSRIAVRTGAAIIVVRHLTKSSSGSPLNRGLGSVAVSAAARSCLRLMKDPSDSDRRVLVHIKCNFGPPSRSVCFRPIDRNGTVATEYAGYHELKIDDLNDLSGRSSPQLDEAKRIIFGLLRHGKQPAKTCLHTLKEAGISNSTSIRAKTVMEVRSKGSGFGSGLTWFWELPAENAAVARLLETEQEEFYDNLFNGGDYIDDDEDGGDVSGIT